MKDHVVIEEQGLRDGIQNLTQIIATEKKIEFINKLVEAGVKRIQVCSFVHPRLVPQMADAEAVCAALPIQKDVIFSGLVLNLKGVERGIDAGLSHLACSISASDLHSQKNARKTLQEAKVDFGNMVKSCQQNNITVRGGIQCAFGCRYEGKVEQEHVLDLVKHHLDMGIEELALADSTGMANPVQVEALLSEVKALTGEIPIVLHLHNTESKGYANLYAAIKSGVTIFDTSFGGLGGCPFIDSASGNIATEDTVHMLHQMGFHTGINVKRIAAISNEMESLLGERLQGNMYDLYKNADIEII